MKRNIFKLSTLLILIVGLNGCIKEDAGTAVEKFMYAASIGDVESYNKYSTENTRKLLKLNMMIQNMCTSEELKTDEGLSKCLKKLFGNSIKFKAIHINEKKTGSAIVTVEEHLKSGEISKEDIPVEQYDGQWKVHITK